VDRAVETRADRLCATDGTRELTWVQARAQAWRLAGGLSELGVGPGDRVVVQLQNSLEALVTYYALGRLGAVMVPRMTIYREHEVSDAIERTEAKVLIVPGVFRGFDHGAMGRSLKARCPSLGQVVVVGEAPGSALTFHDVATADPYLGPRPAADDLHIVLFTSGTTAKPKGVMHSFNTFVTCAKGLAKRFALTPDDICLMPSPLMHNTGLQNGALIPAVTGCASVLQEVWEPNAGLELINRYKATFSVGATPFVTMMVDAYDPDRHDLSSFRLFACGGAPVPASVVRDAVDVLGCTLMTVFGQTESSLQTITKLDDPVERVASSDGRAPEGTDVAILNDDGQELPSGQEGEICSRGPGVMVGYWRDPQRTKEAFEYGWFHSGDLGRMDADGYVRVTGRKKDIIIRGGTNISPSEIEELLLEHPSVADVTVVGLPDRVLGERACAFVVPASGTSPTLTELTDFLRHKKIAVQKLPERLELRDELPRTATGKVEKYRLRDALIESQMSRA
jgi:acyl-CoA synthetase (AMP-forming)/AMP-acid ligase II